MQENNVLLEECSYIEQHLLAQQGLDIKLIYLFGSRAQGTYTDKSDWDVAMLCSQPVDNLYRWELAQELACHLNNDVDLVDLLECSTVLQKQVIDGGVLLYDADSYAAAFDMQVVSMYSRLQEGRKPIIDAMMDKLKNDRS